MMTVLAGPVALTARRPSSSHYEVMNPSKLCLSKATRSALALSVLFIASCSLPSQHAWRIINTQGLFPYIAMEMGKRPVTPMANLKPVYRSAFFDYPWQPGYSVAQQQPRQVAPLRATPIIPRATQLPVVQERRVKTAPTPARRYQPPAVSTKPKTQAPKVNNEVAGIPRQGGFIAEPEVTTAPSSTPPPAASYAPRITAPQSAAPQSAPQAPTPPQGMTSLPYGKVLPNRPGMVNSPYAAAHQVVDVTGLKPGQEVKCPFSGKLFRVPGSTEAASKPKMPEITSPESEPKKP
jgi:hypothetical protein